MECRARDWLDFLNVALQTADVRKAQKMAMKIEIVKNTTYKLLIKNVRIFDHEKNSIEKIAILLSHSIFTKNGNVLLTLIRPENSSLLMIIVTSLLFY